MVTPEPKDHDGHRQGALIRANEALTAAAATPGGFTHVVIRPGDGPEDAGGITWFKD